MRVALLEDEDLFRDLLRIALAQHPSVEVVGSFRDGAAALRDIPALRPQVAILDIELSDALNGIQVGLLLRRSLPDLGVILLSNHGDPEFLGAVPTEAITGWSYLLKKSVSNVEVLGRAVAGAAAGLVVLDPQLVSSIESRGGGVLDRLTGRQREILALIAQGFNNSGVAERLMLAEKTVENQINQLYQALAIERGHAPLHPRVQAVLAYLYGSRWNLTGARQRGAG